MSTRKTQNYQLNIWTAEDEERLDEVNENFAAIDEAISNRCRIVFGTYTGSGGTVQTIELGGTPRAVLISRNGMSWSGNLCYGGLVYPNYPSEGAEIVENGFRLRVGGSTGNRGNVLNDVYQYMAFFWDE